MSAPKRRKAVVETWRPARYDCCHCRRDVRGETHLRPVDEEKEELALCTDCYSVGRTDAFGYKWTADAVRVIDTAATGRPLLVEDWLADQEVRLLDGILQYGFGNWRAVAEHMGGDKTEQMCEEHYETFYLRSKTFPLPDLSGPPKKPAAPAETKQAGAGLGDTDAASSTVPKEKRGASGMIIDGNQVAPADLVGYMPLRGEYDTEWENDAELAICELEMPTTETPEEYQRNVQLLLAYDRQLGERQRRRDFVQKHDIIERAARHHGMDRRLTREERAFRTAMRPYAPHTTPDSHEDLIKSALKETALRRRVHHLRACAQAGIRDLPEAERLWRQALAEEESSLGKPSGPSSRSTGGGGGVGGSHHAASSGLGADVGPGAGPQPPAPPTGGFLAPKPLPSAQKLALQAAKASKVQSADPGGVQPSSLLSADENVLCLSLGLAPSQYVSCKRLLLTAACTKLGQPLSSAEAQAALKSKLDARRSLKLWHHAIKNGWLPPAS